MWWLCCQVHTPKTPIYKMGVTWLKKGVCLCYSEAWGPPQFQENALGVKRPFSKLSEIPGYSRSSSRNSENWFSECEIQFSEWHLTDLSNTKTTILGAIRKPQFSEQYENHNSRSNSRSDSRNWWEPTCKIFICLSILGVFFQVLGWSPRARVMFSAEFWEGACLFEGWLCDWVPRPHAHTHARTHRAAFFWEVGLFLWKECEEECSSAPTILGAAPGSGGKPHIWYYQRSFMSAELLELFVFHWGIKKIPLTVHGPHLSATKSRIANRLRFFAADSTALGRLGYRRDSCSENYFYHF